MFTSVVLGTEQDIIEVFAENGDVGLVRGLASVTGQEGEQEGFYRILQQKIPNELPFLTTCVREFLFTALQNVVTGSCPSQNMIELSMFSPLTLVTTPAAETSSISFTYDTTALSMSNQTLSAVFINQQNMPVVETVTIERTDGTITTANALFPYDEHEMNGLTILTLTNCTGPFANADAVANATEFGPAFIVIN